MPPMMLGRKDITMDNEINNKYIQKKLSRKKNIYRCKLGMTQMIHFPLLNILLLPIIILTVIIWINIDYAFKAFDVPEIILPIYTVTIRVFGVLIPLLLVCGLINVIGFITSRKDEALVQMAFREKELRNGSPILMYKRKDRRTGVTTREWYSPIPMKLWVERQEEIADAMNIHFVQKFMYGGKSNGNRIVMCSAEGREATARGVLYDEEF